MNVCLATAPMITEYRTTEELESDSVQDSALDRSLGVLSLAAVLEARGDSPWIVDLDSIYLRNMQQSGDFVQAAAEEMAAGNAQIYGFSSICSSYPLTLRIAKALKAIRPDSTIVLGGPQASVVDMPTLAAFPFVDMILRGEAERTLPALLDQLQGGNHLDQVPGLSYRVGSQPKRTANAPLIQNLDELPFPAYHLIEWPPGMHTASLELGRGCPFACTFCSTNDFFRRNFRLRSPERVLADMRLFAVKYQIRKFQLVHDMFTVDRKRVVAFCNEMLAGGDEFTWSCSARTDCVDQSLLELMFQAGCRGIFFGVEVGSDKMQKLIDKHLDLREVKEVIDTAEQIGIPTTVSLITGFPEETWDDVRQTLGIFTHSLMRTSASPQLNILAPLAETPLHSNYKHQLLLEELCSFMSHQGLDQPQDDLQLIRAHPDIFPNFYLLPMPHLDRAAILELREFSLGHSGGFRWILVAADHSETDVLDLFFQWRKHRLQIRPELRGPDLRYYYRTSQFRRDYIKFLCTNAAGCVPVVQALMEYNEAVMRNTAANEWVQPLGSGILAKVPLLQTDVPVKRKGVVLVEIGFDLQRVIEALKNRSEPDWLYGRHFYAVRFTSDLGEEKGRADKISDWMACVLKACDGHRTIKEVVNCVSPNLAEIEESLREYAVLRLLEGARTEGLVEIYRHSGGETAACRQGTQPLAHAENLQAIS